MRFEIVNVVAVLWVLVSPIVTLYIYYMFLLVINLLSFCLSLFYVEKF